MKFRKIKLLSLVALGTIAATVPFVATLSSCSKSDDSTKLDKYFDTEKLVNLLNQKSFKELKELSIPSTDGNTNENFTNLLNSTVKQTESQNKTELLDEQQNNEVQSIKATNAKLEFDTNNLDEKLIVNITADVNGKECKASLKTDFSILYFDKERLNTNIQNIFAKYSTQSDSNYTGFKSAVEEIQNTISAINPTSGLRSLQSKDSTASSNTTTTTDNIFKGVIGAKDPSWKDSENKNEVFKTINVTIGDKTTSQIITSLSKSSKNKVKLSKDGNTTSSSQEITIPQNKQVTVKLVFNGKVCVIEAHQDKNKPVANENATFEYEINDSFDNNFVDFAQFGDYVDVAKLTSELNSKSFADLDALTGDTGQENFKAIVNKYFKVSSQGSQIRDNSNTFNPNNFTAKLELNKKVFSENGLNVDVTLTSGTGTSEKTLTKTITLNSFVVVFVNEEKLNSELETKFNTVFDNNLTTVRLRKDAQQQQQEESVNNYSTLKTNLETIKDPSQQKEKLNSFSVSTFGLFDKNLKTDTNKNKIIGGVEVKIDSKSISDVITSLTTSSGGSGLRNVKEEAATSQQNGKDGSVTITISFAQGTGNNKKVCILPVKNGTVGSRAENNFTIDSNARFKTSYEHTYTHKFLQNKSGY